MGSKLQLIVQLKLINDSDQLEDKENLTTGLFYLLWSLVCTNVHLLHHACSPPQWHLTILGYNVCCGRHCHQLNTLDTCNTTNCSSLITTYTHTLHSLSSGLKWDEPSLLHGIILMPNQHFLFWGNYSECYTINFLHWLSLSDVTLPAVVIQAWIVVLLLFHPPLNRVNPSDTYRGTGAAMHILF